MDRNNSTIAFVTDDGTTISPHFGRALYYEVITLKEGQVADRKRLEKQGHHMFGRGEHGHGGHGHGPHQAEKHAAMTAPLEGVAVLIARGMGMGAHQHLQSSGIQPVLTDLHTIDEAVAQYVSGSLNDNPRRLHQHGPHHDH